MIIFQFKIIPQILIWTAKLTHDSLREIMEIREEYSIELEKKVQEKWENEKIFKFLEDEKRPSYNFV